MAPRRAAGPDGAAAGGCVQGLRDGRAPLGRRRTALPCPRRQRRSPALDPRLQGRQMIVVRALGPADVSVNGAAAPAELLWKKNLALLVYLARSPKRLRTREHLVGLLWADKPEKDARHSLNEAVRVLRQSTGGGLESDAAQVRVAPGAVELDTDALELLTAAGDYSGAAGPAGGGVPWGGRAPRGRGGATSVAGGRGRLRPGAGGGVPGPGAAPPSRPGC